MDREVLPDEGELLLLEEGTTDFSLLVVSTLDLDVEVVIDEIVKTLLVDAKVPSGDGADGRAFVDDDHNNKRWT